MPAHERMQAHNPYPYPSPMVLFSPLRRVLYKFICDRNSMTVEPATTFDGMMAAESSRAQHVA